MNPKIATVILLLQLLYTPVWAEDVITSKDLSFDTYIEK